MEKKKDKFIEFIESGIGIKLHDNLLKDIDKQNGVGFKNFEEYQKYINKIDSTNNEKVKSEILNKFKNIFSKYPENLYGLGAGESEGLQEANKQIIDAIKTFLSRKKQ